MRRFVATLIAAVALALSTHLLAGAAGVSGQAGCSFVRGFATLRDLVGAQEVGACLEDERFNDENGNAEQRTAGGLMVWRKADNFTAFTDGGTTWVNGPNGLESRPNSERFSWESDPVVAARPSQSTSSPSPRAPSTSVSPALASTSAAQASSGSAASTGDAASLAAAQAAAQAQPAATRTPTNSPAGGATSTTAAGATPATVTAATPTTTQAAAPTATPTSATTPTPTPNPIEVKFRDKPDRAETGNDIRFEVETNAKKGTCVLALGFGGSKPEGFGSTDVEDGRCEWKWTLPEKTKRCKATAVVSVTANNGGSATIQDTFDVRRGDATLGGNIEIELGADDLPDELSVGEQFDVSIDTNLKNRGECVVVVTWPKIGQELSEKKTPNGNGRCSWKMTVPTSITKDGEATLVVIVTRNKNTNRTLTKEIEIKK